MGDRVHGIIDSPTQNARVDITPKMVEPCLGIKTCKSIKVSKFNFRPILVQCATLRVNEGTDQFYQCVLRTERAKSRNCDADRIQQNEMILHLVASMLNDRS